jgi:hypothetical protein
MVSSLYTKDKMEYFKAPTCDLGHYQDGLCVLTRGSYVVDVHLPGTRLFVPSAMFQLYL